MRLPKPFVLSVARRSRAESKDIMGQGLVVTRVPGKKRAARKAALFGPSYRPVRASEWTQPCMRDFALAMSLSLKKSLRSTLSTAYTGRMKSLS